MRCPKQTSHLHTKACERSCQWQTLCIYLLCAVWGSWARYVYKTNPARFAQFAVRIFDVPENFYDVEATALKGIEAWEDWCHKIGMPINLHELGIDPTDDQIKEMAEKCVATGGGTVGFFQPLNKDDIINIYKMSK